MGVAPRRVGDAGWLIWAFPASAFIHALAIGGILLIVWARPARLAVRVDPVAAGVSSALVYIETQVDFQAPRSTDASNAALDANLNHQMVPAPRLESGLLLDDSITAAKDQLSSSSVLAQVSLQRPELPPPPARSLALVPTPPAGMPDAAAGPLPRAGNPAPKYPEECRRKGQQGTVMLRVLVTNEGTVRSLSVEQSSGSALLDQSAVSAAATWRFDPAFQNGQTAEAEVLLPIRFSLRPATSPIRQ